VPSCNDNDDDDDDNDDDDDDDDVCAIHCIMCGS
jgi:hypothetical protein